MGVVYEAEQVSLKRRVALKVLPFAATLDPKQLARFRLEAQAAAGLHHTNIVPVYAVGSERGTSFYAMQFIDGHSLADAVRQLRRPARPLPPTTPAGEPEIAEQPTTAYAPPPGRPAPDGEPSTQPVAVLSTEEGRRGREYFRSVARLGAQAAEALDYAHQLGVVHRDVKPANLLVDGQGRLWVTDFGLAQVQSEASLTATGDLVGTLRYMSPEQALAKRVPIDHRTDVYSLGATLYELLTLRPPFPGTDRQELLRQIAFDDAMPPRRLDRSIPPELETVVLKALEKNPHERYATAQELADDLRRWLDDRPTQARPPSLVYRLRKWCRRRRPLVTAAGVVALMAAFLGSSAATWYVQERAAGEWAVASALEEAGRFQEKQDWTEALSAARRAEALAVSGSVSTATLQRARERLADLEMARKLEAIPAWFEKKGSGGSIANDYSAAFREFGLDVTKLEPAAAAERIRSRTISVRLAAALDDWAMAAGMEAKPGRKELLELARAADPDELRNRLRDALERMDPVALKKLAASEEASRLGPASLTRLGRALQWVQANDEANTLLRRVQKEHAGDFALNLLLARTYAAMRPPRWDEAIVHYKIAVALRARNVVAWYQLGWALFRKGDREAANEVMNFAARINAAPYGDNDLGPPLQEKRDFFAAPPAMPQGARRARQPEPADLHAAKGSSLKQKGALDEAAAEYREVIRLQPGNPRGYRPLGNLLMNRGQFTEARETLRRGQEKTSEDPHVIDSLAYYLRRCDDLAALDGKLSQILRGEAQPADNAERLRLARWCVVYRQLDRAAVRLFRDAFPRNRRPPRTCNRKTAITRPARPPSPGVAGGRTRTRAMPGSAPGCAARPWSGCGPTWPSTGECWKPTRIKLHTRCGLCCGTGKRTRTSPACAGPTLWPACPRRSAATGPSCGTRSRRCAPGATPAARHNSAGSVTAPVASA
jgi:serine/threonine protein kinase